VREPRSDAESEAAYYRLFLRSRLLSLLLATGALAGVYIVGRLLTTPVAAFFATALVGTMPPFVFYAKLANVDVPALFWWSVSLVFLVRALRGHGLADHLLLAATAAAAVGTKDQMYGLYVLCAPWLVWSRTRRDGATGGRGWLRAAVRREPLSGAALFVVLLALIHGLPWNLEGFRSHLALITGRASQDFREFSRGLGGQAWLAAQTSANLAFALGGPALLACAAGVLASVRGTHAALPRPALLIPAASYHVFFSMVVLYSYDRFVLPVAVLLALFGGGMLARLWEVGGPWRPGLRAAVVALLAYGAGRCLSLDLAMARDARYAAEAWLREHAAPPAVVSPIGPLEYLPRMAGLEARPLGPAVARLERVRPAFVVVSADYAERADPGSAEHALYAGLESGALGYVRVFARRFERPGLLLRTEDLLDRPGALVRSNIGKVNPEIRIYARQDRAGGSR
jgi:4-amino-4-deoxy-L-arabinose transferase-like glycosyltransferase